MSNPTDSNDAGGPDELSTDPTSTPSADPQWASSWEPGSVSGESAESAPAPGTTGSPESAEKDATTSLAASEGAQSSDAQPYGGQPGDQSYGDQSYDGQPYGAPATGQAYGSNPYAAPQYGAQSYGAPQYGAPQFGTQQYGAQPYAQPYGAMQPYGQAGQVARKEPALMLIASFFIPGLGTILNGETGKGIGILAGYLIGIPLIFVLIGIPMVLGFWIWGMVDAYQGAQKFNAAHGLP